MSMVSIETIIEKLKEAIVAKDKTRTLLLVLQLKESVATDLVAVKWITQPVNLKDIHDSLVEHLGVPPKAMMVKHRVPNQQRRGLLFVQAIENGVRRTLNE